MLFFKLSFGDLIQLVAFFVFSFFLLTPDLFVPLPIFFFVQKNTCNNIESSSLQCKIFSELKRDHRYISTVFLSSPHIFAMNRDRIRDFFESVVYLLLVMLWCCLFFCCEQHHILMAPSKRKTPAYNSLIIIAHDAYSQSLPQQTGTAQRHTHTHMIFCLSQQFR